MIFEVVEKETNQDYVNLRERIIYLLSNAYLNLHDEGKCLICLQICSNPNTSQIQYLYLRYYMEIRNISDSITLELS